jgi:TolA-binding protein
MATTTKLTKKNVEQDEFIERVFDLGEWLEAHWRTVAIGAGAVVAVVLLAMGWMGMKARGTAEANDILAKGMRAYQPSPGVDGRAPAPNFAEALTLFEQAAGKAGSGALGDVARLYQARTLITMGRASEATPILELVSRSGNARLAAQAKVALADGASAAGDHERAASLLQEVITSMAAAYPPDGAMMRLAGVRERQGRSADARRTYEDLIAKYPQSIFAEEARRRSGELRGGG